MKGIKGKVSLVTGGGSGIGRATAEIFGREGAKVVIANRTESKGQDVVEAIQKAGGTAMFVKTDVTSSKDVQAIVNTASAAGLVALPGAVAYNVAKWGTVGLTKTAAMDYVKSNIRVNCVCPSFVQTPITDALAAEYPEMIQKMFPYQPIGRLGTPAEIGEAVVWLSSEDASFVTGTSFSVDGGYTAM